MVKQIDFCSSRNELALGISSTEPKFNGKIETGGNNDAYIVMVHDVTNEKYKWAKVIDRVKVTFSDAVTVVKYTPDCSKILVVAWRACFGPNYIYFNPDTGDQYGTAKTNLKCSFVTGKDAISMNIDGSTIFSMAHGSTDNIAFLTRTTFGLGKFNLEAKVVWKLDDTTNVKQLAAYLHNTRVITTSSARVDSSIPVTRSRCRTDIWPADFTTQQDPEQSRASKKDIEINCRFPEIRTLSTPGPGAATMALM